MGWLSRLLVAAVMVGSTSLWAADGDLPGSGTEGDPYLIEDLADFDEFADSVNATTYWASGVYTKLACDPNLADRTYTTAVIAPDTSSGGGFVGTPFEGIFDGDGHVINNLTIDTAGAGNDWLGLFGKIEGSSAEVKNLGMENVNITDGIVSHSLGGLCGSNGDPGIPGGTITNCYATGSVTGGEWSAGFGGLCGDNFGGTITNCYATGAVTGGDNSWGLGGLCGVNLSRGTISDCYSGGSVTGGTGSEGLGGLCAINGDYGGNPGGTISNSYSDGSVNGGDLSSGLGGLCGDNVYGTIANCYSTGSVSGGAGSSSLRGLCGDNVLGTITNCFWDVEASGIGIADDDNFGATGKTTEQMQTESTFTDATWDFTNESTNGTADIWRLCLDGTTYPRLAWEFGSDYSCPDGVSIEDLLYLSSRWLESGLNPYTSADRTGDGKVTIEEYALLAQQWTRE